MRNLRQILWTVALLLCLPAAAVADRDDSAYLVGAVPEENGKVVFSKEFSIPGMTKDEIFERMKKWMSLRLGKNENNSRVVYTNQEKGQVVGTGDEWIVFSSSAISLDRTRILYQPSVTCYPERCVFRLEKIRFLYHEGRDQEKYTAEEWITDKYALNKDKTKLIRGLAKWRRKTVDFAGEYCLDVADALSAPTLAQVSTHKETEGEKEDRKKREEQKESDTKTSSLAQNAPMVITAKKQVFVGSSSASAQATPSTSVATPAVVTPVTVSASSEGVMKEVQPDAVPAGAIQMGAGQLVITIAKDAFNTTTMTANAGGSIGKVSGRPVVFTLLSPDQPYDALEQADSYIVQFYPNGQNEPTLRLQCRKLPSQPAMEGQPRMYIGEIVKAYMK